MVKNLPVDTIYTKNTEYIKQTKEEENKERFNPI